MLHAELEVGKDFSTWIKDQIDGHKLAQGKHFEVFTEFGENPKGGRPSIDYHLDPEAAKHIAAASKTEAGRDIRSYLIECERQLRTGEQPRFKQLETLPDQLPKLTHVSTLDERIDDLVGRGLRLMTGLTQDLKEIKKSVDNRRLNLRFDQENPKLPGIQDAELKAAQDHNAKLQATLTKIEKERDELEAKVAELEKPAKTEDPDTLDPGLVNSLECQIERMSDTLATKDARVVTLEKQVAEQAKRTRMVEEELHIAHDKLRLPVNPPPRLPGIPEFIASQELKDAKDRIAQLETEKTEQHIDCMTYVAAVLKRGGKAVTNVSTMDRIAELHEAERQRDELTAAKQQAAIAEMQSDGSSLAADKLQELIDERERLFDQQQLKLQEAEREKEVLISRIEAPTRGTNLTDFFKETASFLGYTDALGHEYLVSVAKILFRKPNEAGDLCYLPTAEFDRNGWFHVVPSVYTKPEAVDGVKTGKRFKVKTWMLYLTPDQRRPDGSVYKIGGYTWLKQHMMKAELTTLQRLIVETGGPRGEFKRLDGYILSKVHDDSLPGLESTGEEVITIAKGTGDGELKKGAWVAGCRTESGTEQATGLTLRDALRNLQARGLVVTTRILDHVSGSGRRSRVHPAR